MIWCDGRQAMIGGRQTPFSFGARCHGPEGWIKVKNPASPAMLRVGGAW